MNSINNKKYISSFDDDEEYEVEDYEYENENENEDDEEYEVEDYENENEDENENYEEYEVEDYENENDEEYEVKGYEYEDEDGDEDEIEYDVEYEYKDDNEESLCLKRLQELKEEQIEKRRMYNNKLSECENIKYGKFISNYFPNNKLNHSQLLEGLMNYYKYEKNKNLSFFMSFQNFIDKFSKQKMIGKINYKKQHVFEALCRLLLLFNYDNGELGNKKQFYNSLEDMIMNRAKHLNYEDILNKNINVGNEAGNVDILFEIKINDINVINNKWACEINNVDLNNETKETNINSQKNELIMIQNKYYEIEKSNISDYDIADIFTFSEKNSIDNTELNNYNRKIVLMINNEDALTNRLKKSRRQYPGLIYKIYGTRKIDEWFQKMLFDLYKSKNIINFISQKYNGKLSQNNNINQRFHQLLFTKTTREYLNEGKNKKFIWGAVPRSGKSFMIGGFISDRYNQDNIRNNIIIILGAKAETEKQFIDMFQSYNDFKDYNILTPKKKYNYNDNKKLNILIISQEWLKDKIKTLDKFIQTLYNEFTNIFNPNNKIGTIDLFFDEIHKGGSTDKSETIIRYINDISDEISTFIMVTATFSKPSIRYNTSFIDSINEIILIEWNYEDQQRMKGIINETQKEMMINSRKTNKQQKIIREIFNYYQEYYGLNYLNVLSEEYKKHPELVLISHETIPSNSDFKLTTNDIRNIFTQNLICEACKPNQFYEFYSNPRNIFKDETLIGNLLDYIHINIHNYFINYLQYPIKSPHTELWFLPDNNLYETPDMCKSVCKQIETDNNQLLQTDNDSKKKELANIEPLTRGLALKIIENSNYNDYNILIVHGTKLSYLNRRISPDDIYRSRYCKQNLSNCRIKMYEISSTSPSLSEQIKNFEIHSYKNQKSLIILTGQKLRLGISLPCADIAFNFDNIKSIDSNYQTMFRVLTERPEKLYGYYVDFNKDRSIEFLYEYNKVYGSGKGIGELKESVDELKNLLFTFNYNGLGIIKKDTKEELNLYNMLINELNLNEKSYKNYYTNGKNIKELLRKQIGLINDKDIIYELSKIFGKNLLSKKNKIKKTMREGNKKSSMPKYEFKNPEIEELDEEKENELEELNDVEIINIISENLPSIIFLLALFSDEQNYNCNNINDCLENARQNITQFKYYCDCSIENPDIISCYLNSPGNMNNPSIYLYDDEKLINMLNIIDTLSYNSNIRATIIFIFDNIIEAMVKNKKNRLIYEMNYDDVQNKIVEYLPVRETEKNEFGEVFTPIELIEEMLDKLPKNVWKNPELKWLDPANGIGNFPMVAYKKLMEGLEDWEPNKQRRHNHIIENMLYMIEINPKNVKISKKIFGNDSNICCANFETEIEKCFKQFTLDKFDIIIGNPPFQDNIKKNDDEDDDDIKLIKKNKKPRTGGKNKLYERITIKSLSLLNNNGYLLFVTPDNIMTGNVNKAYQEIIKYNTLYINFNNIKKRYFSNIGQSMCYFLVHTSDKNQNQKTKIINNNNQNIIVIIKNRPINPISEWTNETENIVEEFITNERNNVIYNRGTQSSDYQGGKYKVVYKPEEILRTNDKNLALGLDIKKIILFENIPLSSGFSDFKGEYGVGPHTFYVPFKTNTDGKLLERFFKSNIYKTLVKTSLTSQYLKTSLLSHLNLNKILLKKSSKTKKALTTDDIHINSSKTKKNHYFQEKIKKKSNKIGGNKRYKNKKTKKYKK